MPARILAAIAAVAIAAATSAGVTIIGSTAHTPAPHVLYHATGHAPHVLYHA